LSFSKKKKQVEWTTQAHADCRDTSTRFAVI